MIKRTAVKQHIPAESIREKECKNFKRFTRYTSKLLCKEKFKKKDHFLNAKTKIKS